MTPGPRLAAVHGAGAKAAGGGPPRQP
jgi:hypothetical protein